jgi:hypothetical protein
MYNQALWAFSRGNLPEQSTASTPLQHWDHSGTQLATVIPDSGKSGMGMGMIPHPRTNRGWGSGAPGPRPASVGWPPPRAATSGSESPTCFGGRPHLAFSYLPLRAMMCGMMQLLTSANWQVGDFKIWFNCNRRCSAKISTNPVCPMHKNK